MARTHESLIGRNFGRLTVVEYTGKDKYNHFTYRCKCSCGGEKVIQSGSLTGGLTQSCGCLRREKHAESITKHGASKHPLYGRTKRIQIAIKEDPSSVCESWKEDIWNILRDLPELPEDPKRRYLVRIDETRPYQKDNVEWVTCSDLQKRAASRKTK